MKKWFILSLLLCLAGIVVTSCSDSDNGGGNDVTLEAPINLQAVFTNTSSAIRLTWDASKDADSYRVECNNESVVTKSTEHIFTDLTPAQKYSWRVKALKGTDAESDWAQSSFITKLPVPQGLKCIPSATSVAVSWDPIASVDSFEINIADRTILVAGNSATVDLLSIDTDYTLRVRSIKENTNGDWATKAFKTLADATDQANRWIGNWSGRIVSAALNLAPDMNLADRIPDTARINMNIAKDPDKFNTVLLSFADLGEIVPPEYQFMMPEVSAELYENVMAVKTEMDFVIDTTFNPAISVSDFPFLEDILSGMDLGSIGNILDDVKLSYFKFKIKEANIESTLASGDQSFTMKVVVKPELAMTTGTAIDMLLPILMMTSPPQFIVEVEFTKQ